MTAHPNTPAPPPATPADLTQLRDDIRAGRRTTPQAMEDALAVAASATCRHVFVRPLFDEARALATNPELARLPLAGAAISVKDLFDLQGQPTPAGSTVLADSAPAQADATAVARLKAAGGVVVGRTNMSEFAFSGVGWNPHHGTPANPAFPDGATRPRIPGGSSSGAAVSVATGAAWVGLGSDTGGSIRIPAALCGIVGFKPTARLVPATGALPLSTTLDTVCAMTRSVRDAVLVHQVLAACTVPAATRSLHGSSNPWRLAVARTTMLDELQPEVARAFTRALDRLRARGARIDEIDLPEIADLGRIQSAGGFAAAEAWAWHRHLLREHAHLYDPRVATRIRRGESMSAADYIDLLHARAAWIERVGKALAGFDAVLSPTVPLIAPPIADIATSDDEFFRVNALLLRNTSVVNMLDGCALSMPCHEPGEAPVGLMVWAGPMQDDAVLQVSAQVEQALA